MGDRAEISWVSKLALPALAGQHPQWVDKRPLDAWETVDRARTNDLRYESKDSREMEKCSMSPKLLRVSLEVRAVRYLRGHWPFSSVGEGCVHD